MRIRAGLVICLAIAMFASSCATPEHSEPGLSSRPSPSPSTASSEAPREISQEEAIEAARDALREAGDDWDLVSTEHGELEAVRPGWEETPWGHDLTGELRVWILVMRSGDLSAEVVLDATDASLYGSTIGVTD